MTNFEKYPNTADAVKAWNEYKDYGNPNISFENWYCLDYIEPLSLLDAAKAARDWMAGGTVIGAEGPAAFKKLMDAIVAEEARPKHNFEQIKTADEAYKIFKKICCRDNLCRGCRLKTQDKDSFGDTDSCIMRWLYSSNPKLLINEEKFEESDKLEDRK